MIVDRSPFKILLLIVTALFLTSCGGNVWLPIPSQLLPREAKDVLDRAMAAYRDHDYQTLMEVSRRADGSEIDIAEAQYHMERIRDYLAYDTWEIVSVDTPDFHRYWIVVRLYYADGHTNESAVSLRWFDDGWKETGTHPILAPKPISP